MRIRLVNGTTKKRVSVGEAAKIWGIPWRLIVLIALTAVEKDSIADANGVNRSGIRSRIMDEGARADASLVTTARNRGSTGLETQATREAIATVLTLLRTRIPGAVTFGPISILIGRRGSVATAQPQQVPSGDRRAREGTGWAALLNLLPLEPNA
jgi:hypothetical protein